MDKNVKNNEKCFEKLEKSVYNAIDKIKKLKNNNKKLKGEIGELKRLYALSEKKAKRLKQELARVKSSDLETWQVKEKDIKQKLKNLSMKLSAFERSFTGDN